MPGTIVAGSPAGRSPQSFRRSARCTTRAPNLSRSPVPLHNGHRPHRLAFDPAFLRFPPHSTHGVYGHSHRDRNHHPA